MSSSNRTSITRLAVILVVGLLVGGGAIYLAAPSLVGASTTTQTQTSIQTVTTGSTVVTLGTPTITQTTTETTISTSTVTAPNVQVSTVSTQTAPSKGNTGWGNAWTSEFILSLAAEFTNSSQGPAAWDAAAHPDVYITTNTIGGGDFSATASGTGLCIIDAITQQVVVCRQYSVAGITNYFGAMGSAVSMDGRYIYLPTMNEGYTNAAQSGMTFVIDARTLLVHQIIYSEGAPHHCAAFRLYNGTDVVDCYTDGTSGGAPRTANDTTPVLTAFWIMNPTKDNEVIGGVSTATLQAPYYLAFAGPDGQHLFMGTRTQTTGFGTINLNSFSSTGEIMVVDMSTWQPVKYYASMGSDVVWCSITADGHYTYCDDATSDTIMKIDNVQQLEVGALRAGTYAPYGMVLNYNQTELIVTGKGEAGGQFGKTYGVVNLASMTPVAQVTLPTPVQDIDHVLLNPFNVQQVWGSSNSGGGATGQLAFAAPGLNVGPFGDISFNTVTNTFGSEIVHSGSSHNGAFVSYTVNPDGTWTGQMQSDHNGLHGPALVTQLSKLGITQVVYGSQTYKTEAQRALPGEEP